MKLLTCITFSFKNFDLFQSMKETVVKNLENLQSMSCTCRKEKDLVFLCLSPTSITYDIADSKAHLTILKILFWCLFPVPCHKKPMQKSVPYQFQTSSSRRWRFLVVSSRWHSCLLMQPFCSPAVTYDWHTPVLNLYSQKRHTPDRARTLFYCHDYVSITNLI